MLLISSNQSSGTPKYLLSAFCPLQYFPMRYILPMVIMWSSLTNSTEYCSGNPPFKGGMGGWFSLSLSLTLSLTLSLSDKCPAFWGQMSHHFYTIASFLCTIIRFLPIFCKKNFGRFFLSQTCPMLVPKMSGQMSYRFYTIASFFIQSSCVLKSIPLCPGFCLHFSAFCIHLLTNLFNCWHMFS